MKISSFLSLDFQALSSQSFLAFQFLQPDSSSSHSHLSLHLLSSTTLLPRQYHSSAYLSESLFSVFPCFWARAQPPCLGNYHTHHNRLQLDLHLRHHIHSSYTQEWTWVSTIRNYRGHHHIHYCKRDSPWA
ncbi:hypothetical protein V8G54_027846 [Vigna mungo]|uniref:Uncharacterized protein n=1 Tax=Vigna mungo TaxID=3915 RepID=A0AAQ3RL58_VIGMU